MGQCCLIPVARGSDDESVHRFKRAESSTEKSQEKADSSRRTTCNCWSEMRTTMTGKEIRTMRRTKDRPLSRINHDAILSNASTKSRRKLLRPSLSQRRRRPTRSKALYRKWKWRSRRTRLGNGQEIYFGFNCICIGSISQ